MDHVATLGGSVYQLRNHARVAPPGTVIPPALALSRFHFAQQNFHFICSSSRGRS